MIPYEFVLSSQTKTLPSFPDDNSEVLWLSPILLTARKAVVATSWPGSVCTHLSVDLSKISILFAGADADAAYCACNDTIERTYACEERLDNLNGLDAVEKEGESDME